MTTCPTPSTLARYGFSHGPSALASTPAADWAALLASQNGACGVCGKERERLVVDHEHVRGWKELPASERRLYVRGLVCWFCNHYYLGRGLTLAIAYGVVNYLIRYDARLRLVGLGRGDEAPSGPPQGESHLGAPGGRAGHA